MNENILIGVERCHFYENDKNTPEDFCFPSCLTSLAETLGVDVGRRTTDDGWRQRRLYFDLLAWTGMGFGLLWHGVDGCLSCTDLTQVNETHDHTIELGFAGIGCKSEIRENRPEERDTLKRRIVESIDRGVPVLAFGLIDVPECGLVCGYRDDGEVLLGWDFFQKEHGCEEAGNGMAVIRDWAHVWKFVFATRPEAPPSLHAKAQWHAAIDRGIRILESTGSQGYLAGQAAYAAWKAYVLNDSRTEDELRQRHALHHCLVGSHAEARAYTGFYLTGQTPAQPDDPPAKAAGHRFLEIHDTCWKIWGVLGRYDDPMAELALRFSDPEKRRTIAGYIDRMAQLDLEALALLKQARA